MSTCFALFFKVVFEGEQGVDAGGVKKVKKNKNVESLEILVTRMSQESSSFNLFYAS